MAKEKLYPESPVPGLNYRLKNLAKNNWRGILGFLIGLIFIKDLMMKPGKEKEACRGVWILLIIYYIIQPVAIPAASLLPVFLFPLNDVLTTIGVAGCYFSENIMLLLMSCMLLILWNCSGLDKRVLLHFMCSGDACQFSGKRLVFKASLAAFFTGMFSNKLISTSKLISIITPVMHNLQASSYRKTEPDYVGINDVINNAIQTSSNIGGLLFVHTTFTVMNFKNMWFVHAGAFKEYEDIFNSLSYTCFMAPWVILMFFLNVGYNLLLINKMAGKPTSVARMASIKSSFQKEKDKLPKKMTSHEKQCLFFSILIVIIFLFRWSPWLNGGWSGFRREKKAKEIPVIRESAVAAFFVILLSCLPNKLYFFKYLTAKKKEQLPPAKPTSAILFWKYADMNTYYCMFLVMGAGGALSKGWKLTKLDVDFMNNTGHGLCMQWLVAVLIVVVIGGVFANIMPAMAACNVLVPPVLALGSIDGKCADWDKKRYLGGLAIAISTSFGFLVPHRYTPAFYVKHVGKTKGKRMRCIGFGSLIICVIVTWIAFISVADLIFGKGIMKPYDTSVTTTTTTVSPQGGGGGGSDAPTLLRTWQNSSQQRMNDTHDDEYD